MAIQSANQPNLITLEQWNGINQSSSRPVIDDQELWWLENLFPIAPGHLRAGWGTSAAIYTAPGGTTILRIFFANIDTQNPLGFMFLSNGTVDQVNLNNQVVTHLGQIWQPVAPHYWADLKLWAPNQFGAVAGQNGGVVIGSPQGLYAWDGTTLTGPGAAPPLWFTNGQTHDANNNPLVMPTGLPGIYALEVYKARLWVMGQTVISFSAPSNGADFSTVGGGGSFPYQGDQLTSSFTDLHATSGFLYVFGDSLTNQITDLTLVNQPLSGEAGVVAQFTTQFQNNNVDPQIGQRFFRPVGVWEQMYTLWTGAGIYLLAGSQMTWASAKITNLMNTLNPAPFEPTMCAAHIHGVKWMLFNGQFTDPFGATRSMLLCWSGPQSNQWVAASQNRALTHIGSYEQNSVITPYGTDGAALYQLFAQPDSTLIKRIASKAYNGAIPSLLNIKDWKRSYLEMQDQAAPGSPDGVTWTGTFTTKGGGIPNGAVDLAFHVPPGGYDIVPHPVNGAGINGAFDLTSYTPDFTLARLSVTFDERTLFGA